MDTAQTSTRCPQCGGLNPRAAQWCGQCLTRFVAPEPPRAPAHAPSRAPVVSAPQVANGATRPGRRRAGVEPGSSPELTSNFTVTDAGITWRCRLCENENALAAGECSVCGSSFADTVREPEPSAASGDPNTAALISLFLPGAGHAYLGLWPQGIARAVVSVLVVLITVLSAAAQGGSAKLTAGVFALVSFGWWAVAAHDAFREASGRPYAVILKNRGFLYAVLGILMLMTVLVTLSLIAARA